MFQAQKLVFVGVGSNIDPESHVVESLVRLCRCVQVMETSTFYWTAPIGKGGHFLNGVWRITTDLSPDELKHTVLRGIESELGRVRSADRYAPRTIDLDVLLYGDMVVDEPGLRLPDPDIRTRPFIAIPLLELAPDLVLPDTGERLADLPVVQEAGHLETAAEVTAALRAVLHS